MGQSSYSNDRFQNRQWLFMGEKAGMTVAGTNAAAADVVRVKILDDCTIDKVSLSLVTGGTAAGPVLTYNKSAAGTGALAPFGTTTIGTSADATQVVGSLTSTDFSANDVLVVQVAAGTAASTPKIQFCFGWKERFSNANS